MSTEVIEAVGFEQSETGEDFLRKSYSSCHFCVLADVFAYLRFAIYAFLETLMLIRLDILSILICFSLFGLSPFSLRSPDSNLPALSLNSPLKPKSTQRQISGIEGAAVKIFFSALLPLDIYVVKFYLHAS